MMPIRPIIYLGDERLLKPSAPVTVFNKELQQLIDRMFEIMYNTEDRGIGLALPQIGINQQIAVIDITDDGSQPWCFINPKIVPFGNEIEMKEGCLSIPGAYGVVRRPEKVKVEALDRQGNSFTIPEANGLFARCIQHEYDHLQGVLFIKYLSPLQRKRAIKEHRQYIKAQTKHCEKN